MFALQLLSHGALDAWFALWPMQSIDGRSNFHLWQIVTYSFLHDSTGVAHLLFNMLGLWMFGSEIERYVGPRRLLACYFASVVTAALSQLFVPMLFGAPAAPTIGASGGVFGLLLAYAFLFPRRKVVPLIPPIPMPAWLFATVYAWHRAVPGGYGDLVRRRTLRPPGGHGGQRLGHQPVAAPGGPRLAHTPAQTHVFQRGIR